MTAEAARSVGRPFDKVLAAFGIPNEEQKNRIYQQILTKKSTILYFVLPEEAQRPDRFGSYPTLLTVPKGELLAAVTPKLRDVLKEELNGTEKFRIQTRPLPGGGNSWAVRDDSVQKRVRFFLGGALGVPTTLQIKENDRWTFLKKFPPFDLETIGGLVDYVAARIDTQKLVSVGWPGTP